MKAVKLYQRVEKEFNNVKWRLDELYRVMYSYMVLIDNISQSKSGKDVSAIWRSTLKKRVTAIFDDMFERNEAMKKLLESMKVKLFKILEAEELPDEIEETVGTSESVPDNVQIHANNSEEPECEVSP